MLYLYSGIVLMITSRLLKAQDDTDKYMQDEL